MKESRFETLSSRIRRSGVLLRRALPRGGRPQLLRGRTHPLPDVAVRLRVGVRSATERCRRHKAKRQDLANLGWPAWLPGPGGGGHARRVGDRRKVRFDASRQRFEASLGPLAGSEGPAWLSHRKLEQRLEPNITFRTVPV